MNKAIAGKCKWKNWHQRDANHETLELNLGVNKRGRVEEGRILVTCVITVCNKPHFLSLYRELS